MVKKQVNTKPCNRETGSIGLSTLIGAVVVGLTSLYVQTVSESTSRTVKLAEHDRVAEANYTGSMSSLSRFKALLAGGKATAFKPAVYADNYFKAVWDLQENKSDGVKVELTGPDVHLGSNEVHADIEQYAKIMRGEKGGTEFADAPRTIKVLRTNFSNDGLIAQSLDVQVSQAGIAASAYRINLNVPQPSGVKLEFSRAGANDFKTLTSVDPGSYDIRVLSSGIAYKAVVKVGSEEHVLGIDTATGKIKHALVNPYVVDREIGRFTYTFAGNETKTVFDPTTCLASVVGLGGVNIPVDVAVYGVDRVASEANKISMVVKVLGDAKPGPEVSDEVAAYSCTDQCPYYEPPVFEDAVSARWAKGDYGDYSMELGIHHDRRKYNIMDKKICSNCKKVAMNYLAQYGKPLVDHRLVDALDIQAEIEMMIYSIPSCKREFLYNRGTCGCFAEETKILLGDQKTEKLIHELTEFDRVWNPVLRQSMAIKRMTKGPEKYPMLDITVGGHVVSVTGNHPFPTSTGVLAAYQLNPGQTILTENGGWQAIESIEANTQNRGKDVWNLELDGPRDDLANHYVLANGVITGDLYIQESLAK